MMPKIYKVYLFGLVANVIIRLLASILVYPISPAYILMEESFVRSTIRESEKLWFSKTEV